MKIVLVSTKMKFIDFFEPRKKTRQVKEEPPASGEALERKPKLLPKSKVMPGRTAAIETVTSGQPTEEQLVEWRAEVEKRLQRLKDLSQKQEQEEQRLTARLILREDSEDRSKLGENLHLKTRIEASREKALKAMEFVEKKEKAFYAENKETESSASATKADNKETEADESW